MDDTLTHNVIKEEMAIVQEELKKGGLEIHKQKCLSIPLPLSRKIICKYGKEKRVYVERRKVEVEANVWSGSEGEDKKKEKGMARRQAHKETKDPIK